MTDNDAVIRTASRRHRSGVFRQAPVTVAAPWRRALLAPSARAGSLLLVLPALPVLAVTGWLLVAVPLAALGGFYWWTVLPAAALVVTLLVRWAWPRLLAERARPVPWWVLVATLLVAAGFAALAMVTHSEQAVLHRDAGTYAQIGLWLSGHPGLTSPVPAEAYGPAADMVNFAHPGFYVQGGRIVPQFMTGWPTMLAAGYWAGGWTGIFLLPGIVGACAVLAVAGLAARLCGPRWAPFAALLLAAAWPVLRVSQTTYSEPLACLMLAGGLSLLVAGWSAPASAGGRRPAVVLLGLAGLVLSAGELVRLDMGVDFALVLPAVGWWFLRRRPGAPAFVAGALLGGGLGYLDCRYVTLPYIEVNWSSVRLMIVLLVASVIGTVAGVVALRRRPLRLGPARRRTIARATVAAVVIGGFLLAARPLLYVDRSITAPDTMDYVASHQDAFGLPVDGRRGYAEQSLDWVAWYVGWPAVALAGAGIAAAASAAVRGRGWRLLPVLLVYGGSGLASLLRPAITPDHPWADRRLVLEVLPAVVIFATFALARVVPALRRATWPGSSTVVPAMLVLAAVVPAVAICVPLAPHRTELGEPAAAAAVCRALRPDDAVIMIDTQWAPTVRNECGLPVAALPDPTVERLQAVVTAVRRTGHDPVLMSSSTLPLLPYGQPLERVVYQDEREDQHQLVRRPTGTDSRRLECWLVRP
ncbi:hypothetical protein [Dactylosporangium sp. CA-139066]|uniref:hypothetical protein n=1 Tax=Dactylosporangium sp. CA-139066 TaxID=3239930 RepID=UPI003D8C2DC7